MFCCNCRASIDTTTNFCSACGAATGGIGSIQATQQAAAATAPAISSSEQAAPSLKLTPSDVVHMAAQPKIIGGWLLLFCISTILLTPLLLLKDALASSLLRVYIVDGILICASVSAGIAVATASRRAKIFVRIFFLLVLIMVGRILVRLVNAGTLEITDLAPAIRSTAHVVIWSLYFRSSKRIKETFGENW